MKYLMHSAILKWNIIFLAALPILANAQMIDLLGQSYVGMDLGGGQTHMSRETTTVPNGSNYPLPEAMDEYSLNPPQPIMLDIQVGYRWDRDHQWIPSYVLALQYEHIFTKNITGKVTQYSDPEFMNYSYSLGINADITALYFKLDIVRYAYLMPYIDLGLGISFNQSHGYHETAFSNVIARDSPDYASKTNYQCTYNLGAGLDFIISKQLLMSLGYRYQSLGNLSTGFGLGSNWGNTQLNLGRIYYNIGFIGFSYLF